MRKAIKLCLALSLVIPTTLVTLNNEKTVIAAKVIGNYAYEIIDGNNIKITNYNGSDKEVIIPSELDGKKVTKIGYGAFAECKSIEKLIIPNSINVIEAYAFSQCDSIQSIELPDSIVSLGKYAFAGNSKLKNVIIPANIKSLSYGLFFDCISLENAILPEGVETIGSVAFGNCKSLSSVELPSTLMSLDSNAFSECVSLASIVLPEGVTFVGSGVFSGCLSLSNVQLPSTLTSIAQSAFKDCIALKTIELPAELSAIGYGAFTGCTSLENIQLPEKITTISDATFSGCSSLTSFRVAGAIESIGAYAFSGCINLADVYISDQVESIGMNAFSNCRSLKTIRLPKQLTIISESLFRYCDSLESVILSNGITQIGATAFADCPSLLSVTFPASIVKDKIGSRILSNSPNATMMVSENSEAHRYARQNNIPFRLIEKGINFDKNEFTLSVGEQNKLTVIMAPYIILDNTQLTWTSSNPSVASVDEMGNITGNGVGNAIITAKNANGLEASAQVHINDKVEPITEIILNTNTVTLATNSSTGLRATINPKSTTMSKIVNWRSEDVEIATVNSTGSVFARRPGTTKIYATTSNGLEAICTITVTSDIKSISLNQTAMALEVGTKQHLRATINPSDTTQSKDITWSSSNEKVATVDQNGEVTTIASGTATITVKTINGKKAECKITVTKPVISIPILSVDLDKDTAEIETGDSLTLKATINPSDTTDDKTLRWTSSDETVALVADGTITALKEGTSDITVITSNGKRAVCHLVVKPRVIAIKSVELNKTDVELEEGAEETLIATILPANTTEDKTLVWTSSKEDVVAVHEGTLKAIKEGSATIKVTTVNGKEATCVVQVSKKPVPITSVVLDVTSSTLKVGKTTQLKAEINPSNTTFDKTLVWSSSDDTIAKVEQDGKVSALREGTAQIRVTTSNELYATCDITVFNVSKDQLKAKIDEANTMDANIYTLHSYQFLMDTVASATEIYERDDALQEEVNAMVTLLDNALRSLSIRASDVQVNELTTMLQICRELASSFTPEEFKTMLTILEEGDALLKIQKENISSEAVLHIIQSLQDEKANLDKLAARNNLTKLLVIANTILESDVNGIQPEHLEALKKAVKESQALLQQPQASVTELELSAQTLKIAIEQCETKTNKENLKMLIELCSTYQSDAYTASSWERFENSLSEAIQQYNDLNATQQAIDTSYETLMQDFVALKRKVNTAILESNIEIANDILLHKGEYVSTTIKGLDSLLEDAKMLIVDANASVEQVNDMNTKIVKAIMKARKKAI